jgi:hypothetical protein
MYLHIIPTSRSAQVINSSYFRCKADASSTMDTSGHDCFYQWPNIFIFHCPRTRTLLLLLQSLMDSPIIKFMLSISITNLPLWSDIFP